MCSCFELNHNKEDLWGCSFQTTLLKCSQEFCICKERVERKKKSTKKVCSNITTYIYIYT
jgi:hypothetical protein